jgi:hypothetical protein
MVAPPIWPWSIPDMPDIPAIAAPTATVPWSVGPFQPVSFHRLREAFCIKVWSGPRFATGFSSDIPDMPDIPCIPPMLLMSMPISVMVSSVRGRSGGTGATMPSRGASVARPIPDRSIASETKL